jgi:hypothetical protein
MNQLLLLTVRNRTSRDSLSKQISLMLARFGLKLGDLLSAIGTHLPVNSDSGDCSNISIFSGANLCKVFASRCFVDQKFK